MNVMSSGLVKPIVIVAVDGRPDENPRFPKSLSAALKIFNDNNLDPFLIACHATGHSAYNVVERHMAPMSNDLSGLILPYNYYGSHLDNHGRTIDAILEMIDQLQKSWGNFG